MPSASSRSHRGRSAGLLLHGGVAGVCLLLGSASPAGDASKQLHIPGFGGQAFLAGSGIDVNGDSMIVHPQSGASIVSACNPSWRPEDIAQFKLVGKTMSFTVDLSGVGCACNLAFYLVSAPARDEQGNAIPGDNNLAPGNFYCDANKVGGQWCPEVDIMEANNHAFQSTPHKCDPPTNGHYPSCDRGGCGQNTRDMANAYGPGSDFRIDTTKPFKVITAFTEHKGSLVGMVTTLQQGSNRVTLDHGTCQADYYSALSPAMVSGMSLRITYWGSDAGTMSWLDKPPCGGQSCSGGNAGQAVISNIEVSSSTGASASSQAVLLAPGPASPGQATTWQPAQPSVTAAPVQNFDCTDGLTAWEGWESAKRAWCCSNDGVACGRFNCFEHLENWGQRWSSEKQAWCCRHKAQGCPQSPGAPGAGARQQVGPLRWSNFPVKCFTETGGDLVIKDCDGPNGNSKQIWQSIGDGTIRLAAEPSLCIGVADPETPQNGGRVRVARCERGDLGQEFSINTATMKIQWRAHRHMCMDVTDHKTADGTPLQLWRCLPRDTDQVFSWPTISPSQLQAQPSVQPAGQPAAQTTPQITTSAPAQTTAFVWEPSDSLVLPPTAPPSAAAPAPTLKGWAGTLEEPIATETYTTTTVADPYECDVPDLSRTPYKQRVWCCRYKHLGCPVMIPQTWRYEPPVKYPIHTRASPEINGRRTAHLLHPGQTFQVTEGREGYDGVLYLKIQGDMGWTFETKPGIGTMCVESLPVLATTSRAPYDCFADLAKWQLAWSVSKQAWCCSHYHHGCASPTTTTAPFDCSVGFENWRSAWTVSQAAYCCSTVHRGCRERSAPQEYDCTEWFPGYARTWPEAQRAWCCGHEAKGCPRAHSTSDRDCKSGVAAEWSTRKRLWCCSYRGVGCPGSPTAHLTRRFSQPGQDASETPGGVGGHADYRALFADVVLACVAGGCLAAFTGLGLRRCRRRAVPRPAHGLAAGGAPPPSPAGNLEEVSLLCESDGAIHPESVE